MEKLIENGKIAIPKDYFLKMAKHDYSNYRMALPREFYQNSIDAGATQIHVRISPKTREIEIIDDGSGMTLEVLIDVLLALGGSYKENEDATGAFGKAKEVLFFSWDYYCIMTKNHIVSGSGATYNIEEVDEAINGTHITIKIQESEDFDSIAAPFIEVAEKIETDTQIIVDDRLIVCKCHKGEFLKDIEGIGKLYKNEEHQSPYVHVRINGIWMHQWYVSSDLEQSGLQLTMELDHNSLECLTSNRDDMKWQYKNQASEFITKMILDNITMLRPDKATIVAKIPGEEGYAMSDSRVSTIAWETERTERTKSMLQHARNIGLDQVLMAARMVDEPENNDERESYLKFVGYKADFITKCEKGQMKDLRWFLTSRKAHTIASIWEETLKQVLLDNREFISFKVGFSVEDDIAASMNQNLKTNFLAKGGDGYSIQEESIEDVVFLLNPHLLLKDYPLSNRKGLARKIRMLAIHEVTHIWADYHSEQFSSRREKIDENTWKSDRIYNKISKLK
jgi:hypothetical protein